MRMPPRTGRRSPIGGDVGHLASAVGSSASCVVPARLERPEGLVRLVWREQPVPVPASPVFRGLNIFLKNIASKFYRCIFFENTTMFRYFLGC